MEDIYNMLFKDVIIKYPYLVDIFEKYNLSCSTCDFANKFTLNEILEDRKEIRENIKFDIFSLIKKGGKNE